MKLKELIKHRNTPFRLLLLTLIIYLSFIWSISICGDQAMNIIYHENNRISITADTYYWVYSTLAQLFGALLALFGMFVVYRLQVNNLDLETALNQLRYTLTPNGPARASMLTSYSFMEYEKVVKKTLKTIIELKESLNSKKEMIIKTHPNYIQEHLRIDINRIEEELNERKLALKKVERIKEKGQYIKESIKIPLILSAMVIIISIILLPFGEYLKCNEVCMLDINVLLLFIPIILSIITIGNISNTIYKIIRVI